MSPDSWSAPVAISTPAASVATNTMLPNATPAGGAIVPYQPSSNSPYHPTSLQQTNSSPAIPNLTASATRQAANKIKSLIRQPRIDNRNSVSNAASNSVSQSPFQQTRYKLGGQAGLLLAGPDQSTLSNTSLPAFGNQSSLPESITSATGNFDSDPSTIPAIGNNLPAVQDRRKSHLRHLCLPTGGLSPKRHPVDIRWA